MEKKKNETCRKAQITFEVRQLDSLQEIAEKTGNTLSAVVRIAADDYLNARREKLDEMLKERACFWYVQYAQGWHTRNFPWEVHPPIKQPPEEEARPKVTLPPKEAAPKS